MICRALLTLSLLLPALATNAIQIEFWHAHQSLVFVDQVAKDFAKATGHTVKVTPYAPGDVKAELLLGAQSGLMPDVMLVPSDFLGLYQELRLRPVDNGWNDAQTMPVARATTIVGRNQWGVPVIQGNHLMLFYNKSLVAEPAATWAELIKQKEAIEAKGARLIGWNYGEMFWFAGFLGAFGGWPMDGDQITLNTPAMVAALSYYKDLSGQGVIEASCDYDCAQKAFNDGKFGYAINGDWALADSRRELGDNFGVTTLPLIDERVMTPMSSTYVLAFPMVNDMPEKLPVLKAFARFFQSAEQQHKIYQTAKLLPVNRTVFDQVMANADADTKVMLRQLEQTRPMPSSPAMAVAWQAMSKGFQRLMSGSSAEDAAAVMQDLADRELVKRGGL